MQHTHLDLAWVALTSALVFLMQGGFALLESGLTRSKNSINVAAKNLTDLGVSVLCFWLVGFGLMFGGSAWGLVGADQFFFSATGAWPAVFFLFQTMFCSTSATIVSGAVAERMKFGAYLAATVLMSVVIYPIAGHWAWGGALEGTPSGWLGKLGFVDFAGSTVVHSIGGWVSLAALLVIGPRVGKFDENGRPRSFPGSSIPMAVTGTILLWFGWFGFNGGSTLAVNDSVPVILVNTTLAGAAGMIGCLALGWMLSRKPDVSFIINGSLGGLVAITAGCHSMSPGSALLIGAVGGAVTIWVQSILDRLGIDDAVGAVPVHLGAGIWGTLAVGLLGDPELLKTGLDRGSQVIIQLTGIASIGVFSFLVSWSFFAIFHRFVPLRVNAEDENAGLNVAEHGATTEIYGLFQTLEAQARSGDLSLRAPVEPFTEVGQIARQYNRVMENLEMNLVAKSEYVNILDNVTEGLFLLDGHGRVGPFYSSALEKILGRKTLSGQDFTSVLQTLVSPATLEPWLDYLHVLFDANIDELAVARLNPLKQVELLTDSVQGFPSSRHAQFHFRRILEEGRVVRIMVILKDTTQETRLQRDLTTQGRERDQEMQLFYQLLHLDPTSLREFLEGFRKKVTQINRMLETGQNAPVEILKQTLRILHGIKGDAALLELNFLATSAHVLEDMVQQLQRKPNLENADFLGFAVKFAEFQATGQRMDTLVERLAAFQTDFLRDNRKASLDPTKGALAIRLESLVSRTAAELGKKATLVLEDFDAQALEPQASRWQGILVQLLRNAVAHGIETQGQRKAVGKDPVGRIEVRVTVKGNQTTVVVKDDGQGIDPEAMARRAIESGYPEAKVSNWSRTDVIRYLFKDGVSTSTVANEASGRGVGLPLVSALVKEAGGKLAVNFVTGKTAEFHVALPRPKAGLRS